MPSESSDSWYLHNGEERQSGTPAIAVTDGAIVQGAGIFETIPFYEGTPFAFEEHLDRLRRGAALFSLSLPTGETLRDACAHLIERNQLAGLPLSRVRITVTAGDSVNGSSPWFVEASPPPERPEHATVITIPFCRNERSALVGCKTINYGENAIAMKLARQENATEALFANTRNELCEGTWSNVFVRLDGQWTTPPLESGCLPGVTRHAILSIAEEFGAPFRETTIPMSDLERAEAMFLSSSIREIQPVASIDGRALDPSEEAIASLRSAYRTLVRARVGG